MWSGPMRCVAGPSSSTPSISSAFVPMPWILRAHRVQRVAEALDVRLAGRVEEARLPVGEHRGHHRVLGRGHARLVEEDLGALEAARQDQPVVVVAQLDLGAELAQREHVRVDPAPADLVPARAGEHGFAAAGQERGREQERAADARRERGIRRAAREARRIDAHRAVADARDVRAEATHGFQQCLDVPDPGQVLEDDRARHEQRGGDDGQRLVLVAGGPDLPLDGPSAFDRELIAGNRLDEYGHGSMLPAERVRDRQQLAGGRAGDRRSIRSAGTPGGLPDRVE